MVDQEFLTPNAQGFSFSLHSTLSIPVLLWRWYVDNLWYTKPGSWVENTASTFRVLAILCIAPFAILTLLDVTSYVIARTLGVVDSTKASTSDKQPVEEIPVSVAHEKADPQDSSSYVPTPHVFGDEHFDATPDDNVEPESRPSITSQPTAYFFNSSSNLALHGADIVSPAVSRQGSPGRRYSTLDSLTFTPSTSKAGNKTRSRSESDSRGESNPSSAASDSESFTILNTASIYETIDSGLRRRVADGDRQE